MRRGWMPLGSLRVFLLVLVWLGSLPSRAIDLYDGRVQIHGYVEEQLRTINPNLNTEWNLTMMKTILRLETEVDLAPKGFFIFDAASFYMRLQVNYDCVWTRACGLFPSAAAYGDRTNLAPSYYMTGHRNGFVGDDPAVNPFNGNTNGPGFPPLQSYSGGSQKLQGIASVPGIEVLSPNASFNETFAPFANDAFSIQQLSVSQTTSNGDSSGVDAIFGLWRPENDVHNTAALGAVPNKTSPLPFRPSLMDQPGGGGAVAGGLYVPSPALRQLYLQGVPFNNFDQNFSQNQLAWGQTASEDDYPLEQAYLDLSALEGRLSLRLGRQAIIWGKTELYRNTDQINPSNLGVATLPTLDESRISLWAARAIYSFYDVGPLQDVRAELVYILDRFMPNDLGRCGAPYTAYIVCNLQSNLFLNGALGAGIVGETRPPNWWNGIEGSQVGARIEFRWDRFSFALTDYYHYDPSFNASIIQTYSRKVDPFTGRPLADSAPPDAVCVTGMEPGCLKPGSFGPGNSLTDNPQNRQLFDVICSSSVGFSLLDPASCALSVPNSNVKIGGLIPVNQLISAGLAGNSIVQNVVAATLPTAIAANFKLVPLNSSLSPQTPGQGIFAAGSLNVTLTTPQQALLGCGPFYRTSCDLQGLDFFNTEASALFQSWPGNNPGNAVATRFVNGQLVILPGARGPGDPGYNPLIDGCVAKTAPGTPCQNANNLINPLSGTLFRSQMAALSYNSLQLFAGLEISSDLMAGIVPPPGCNVASAANPVGPLHCKTVQGFYNVTGTTRPDFMAGGNGAFGRRDFVWAGAGELLLDYQKVNTLGFAMDFAEDRTGTNWGIEWSWTPNKLFANSETPNGLSNSDQFALTISVDRPTFINFLNQSRTFFFNMQWFIQYLSNYQGGYPRGFAVNGPLSALGTFTIQTGYFQDRLQPALTLVYDVDSASGGVIFETGFRFTANFSLTVGMNNFYGQPQSWSRYNALGAVGESNQRWTTEKFEGLNPVRERDEVFARLRYTF